MRAGRNSNIWPVVLLLFAMLVPAVCLLWFMAAAMRNERLATRQKLADVYRAQLSSSQARLEAHWKNTVARLEEFARANAPATAFARCVQSGLVDSVIFFDERGLVLYPNAPTAPGTLSTELELKWNDANDAEYLRKDFVAAAERYAALALQSTNVNASARALQGQIRCLLQAGRKETAAKLVDEVLGARRYDRAVDPQGRLIVANAELMVLEHFHGSSAFQSIAQRLGNRVTDYDNPIFAASQRRFLMKELQRLASVDFPTLAAEEWAAEVSANVVKDPSVLANNGIQRSTVPDLWQLATPNHRLLALMRPGKLFAAVDLAVTNFPADVRVALIPPGAGDPEAFVTLSAGEMMPGWRWALSFAASESFDTTVTRQSAIYLWAGLLVLAATGILALLAARILRRQTALARLKNDLAATVSHELKTPLSSMRVLVDTLLDADQIDEKKARDYLQLIARENERLSRVIQNFLTFSRIERKKQTFDLTPVPVRRIVDSAVRAMAERFNAPGCDFDIQIEPDLPGIMADAEALTTALINLLDNAFKYSGEIKHIALRIRAVNGMVMLSVSDNGIGIAGRDTRRIFQPFQQLDSRLSRSGSGCGLGLSIVQSIVTAHGGHVFVESEPGRGSTFTIAVPAAVVSERAGKEAIA